MLENMLQPLFFITLFGGMIRIATPIIYAAMGELIVERAGILNLNVEGAMTMGAFAGFAMTWQTGSLWWGVLAAGLAGVAMSLLMAFLTVSLRQDQTIAGLTLNLLASGLSFYLYRVMFKDFIGGNMPNVSPFVEQPIPYLSSIPLIGPVIFNQHILSYLAFLLVPAVFLFLYRTPYGLALRCLGENPRTVDMKGLSVPGMQYAALMFGGLMSGVGGSFLTLGSAGMFVDGIAAGRGWIAIALVIFGGWQPGNILAGSLFFAFLDSLQRQLQNTGFNLIPYQFIMALPYVVTILALFLSRKRSGAPLALGVPYSRE